MEAIWWKAQPTSMKEDEIELKALFKRIPQIFTFLMWTG
jgi:hypothetical protein